MARIDQINSIIKESLGQILFQEVDQEKFGLITILRVKTAPNLDSCRIWISVLKNPNLIVPHLTKRAYHLQHLLHEKIVLRKIPHLLFKLDNTNEYVGKIEQLLKKI